MQIYIPTFGRSDNQVTWDNLPHTLKFDTQLVIQARETHKYDFQKYPTLILPYDITTIGPTRQYLVEHCGSKHFLMLDDDLDFAVRRTDDPTKFSRATDEDIHKMVEEINASLAYGYKLVGIAAREGANYDTSPFKIASRQLRVHGIDTEFFRKADIRFDRIPFMEDFDVTLQLLELGYPNKVLNNWVHNQRGGSNAPGGCSVTRTLEAHNEAAKQLKNLHPRFVRIVEKESGNWGGARLDVNIAWKKAYMSSQTASGLA